MDSYAVKSVRDQYEKYPYPSYSPRDAKVAAEWLKDRGLQADKVIDVGCGTGLWSAAFAINGSEVTGVDFSKSSLSIAETMANALGVSIKFRQADLFSLKTFDKFSMVFCNGVLHHTANARIGFHRISRFVEKNGTLAVSLYNRLSPFRMAKILVRALGGEDIEMRRQVAQAAVAFPLTKAMLSVLGRTQGGPFTPIREYVSKDENLIDLLCHEYTSYHTAWEIEGWYLAEGFRSVTMFPSKSISSVILPNLIFFFGRR